MSKSQRSRQALMILRPEWEETGPWNHTVEPDRKYIYFGIDKPQIGASDLGPTVRITTDARFGERRDTMASWVRSAIDPVISKYFGSTASQDCPPHQNIHFLEECHKNAVASLRDYGLKRGEFELMPVVLEPDGYPKQYREGIETFRRYSSTGRLEHNSTTLDNEWMWLITGVSWFGKTGPKGEDTQQTGASKPLLLTLTGPANEMAQQLNTASTLTAAPNHNCPTGDSTSQF